MVPGHLVEDAEVSASSSGVDAGEKSQGVQPGRGAYVLSGEWTDTNQGLPYLIDTKGKAYTLVGAGAANQLGYRVRTRTRWCPTAGSRCSRKAYPCRGMPRSASRAPCPV